MKKFFKSLFLKIKSKTTLKTYQKPLIVTIMKLLLINFIVLIIASIIALSIDTGGKYFGGNFFKAFITAVKWMISVNSINEYDVNEDMRLMILAVAVIAIGMVLFSGAIIATLTAAIRVYIDKKSKAKGKIIVENHFVILNYNGKVPDIVYNLMCKGFKNNIVILSHKDKEYITTELESVISNYDTSKNKKKINVIVKEGNPLLRGNLEDISIEKASNIVIVSREDMTHGDDENISNSDLLTLKIMLALGNFNINKNCNIVVELDSEETKDKIEDLSHTIKNLKSKSIIPVSFNKKIGQIIAQTIIEPLMSNIYLELLSYDGYEFYSYNNSGVDGYLANYNNAIPIIKYHKLFVFAEDEKDISKKRDTPYKPSRKLIFVDKEKHEDFTVFVIGDNKKRQFIIDNLKLSIPLYKANFEVKEYHKDDTKSLIKDLEATDGIRKVLILSDDTVSSDSYDANVFVTLIALQSALPDRHGIPFITELLDSRNLNSVKDFNIKNAIISNRIMSLLLSQLALNTDSKPFFDGLLTIDDEVGGDTFDVKINKVKEILDTEQDLKFKSKAELINAFYHGSDKACMLLGIIKNGNIEYLAKKMDEEQEIQLEPSDSLIYVKY